MKNSGYDQFFKKAKSQNKETQSSLQLPVRDQMKKLKKKFPVMPAVYFFALISSVIFVVENLDSINNFIEKTELGLATAEASADKVPAKSLVTPDQAAAVAPGAVEKPDAKTDQTITKPVEDETDYLFKLTERKKELDEREAELNKREENISQIKLQIESQLTELQSYRTKISTLLQEKISTDTGKIETLVQVYSNMKPTQAAKVFETMDEELVIEILSKMKKKNAADILNLVKSDKAKVLAEKFAGYRLPDRKISSQENSDSQGSMTNSTNEQSTKEESDQ